MILICSAFVNDANAAAEPETLIANEAYQKIKEGKEPDPELFDLIGILGGLKASDRSDTQLIADIDAVLIGGEAEEATEEYLLEQKEKLKAKAEANPRLHIETPDDDEIKDGKTAGRGWTIYDPLGRSPVTQHTPKPEEPANQPEVPTGIKAEMIVFGDKSITLINGPRSGSGTGTHSGSGSGSGTGSTSEVWISSKGKRETRTEHITHSGPDHSEDRSYDIPPLVINPEFLNVDSVSYIANSNTLFHSERVRKALALAQESVVHGAETPLIATTSFNSWGNPTVVHLPSSLLFEAVHDLSLANVMIDVDPSKAVELSLMTAAGATIFFVIKNWQGILGRFGGGLIGALIPVTGFAATPDEIINSPEGMRYFLQLSEHEKMEMVQRNPDLASQVLILQSLVRSPQFTE